jgi:hypothetical protein
MRWPWSEPAKQVVVELDLGPNDMLVLTTEQRLSEDTCERLRATLDDAIKSEGRTALVLTEGLSIQVVHRS